MMANRTVGPLRRGGRPPSPDPQRHRRTVFFTDSEARRLNSYMHTVGVAADSDMIRKIVLEHLERHGVEDPGADSALARPPHHPQRPPSVVTSPLGADRPVPLTA